MKKLVLFIFVSAFVLTGLFTLYSFMVPAEVAPPLVSATPSPTITATPTPKNFERSAKLQTEADSLVNLFKMPAVPVYLKDEIVNKEGSSTERGVAYTACENNNQPTIFIKKIFYEKANRKMLDNILKHELTHAYFCRQGIQAGHDQRFRQKFSEVGGIGN